MALDGDYPVTFDRVLLIVMGVSILLLAVAPAPTNTLEIIGVQTNQIMQSGSNTFVKGARAITFARPFSTVPNCVCSDTGGALAECAAGTPALNGITFYGRSNAASFSWICVGTL